MSYIVLRVTNPIVIISDAWTQIPFDNISSNKNYPKGIYRKEAFVVFEHTAWYEGDKISIAFGRFGSEKKHCSHYRYVGTNKKYTRQFYLIEERTTETISLCEDVFKEEEEEEIPMVLWVLHTKGCCVCVDQGYITLAKQS